MDYEAARSGELTRAMIDGDRECVEDVAAWMNALDAEAFEDQVNRELRGGLDQVAAQALRQEANLKRWDTCLKTITVSLQTQLADPVGKNPDRARWRQSTLVVLDRVLERRGEVRHLIAVQQAAASGRDPWQAARTKAVRRLIAGHEIEYLALLAGELTAAGLEVPADISEKLAAEHVDEPTRAVDG